MGLFKRHDKYWVSFTYNHRRYRMSLQTNSKQEANRLAIKAIASVKERTPQRANLSILIPEYLKRRRPYLSQATYQLELYRTNILRQHWTGDLDSYIQKRLSGAASNRTINIEISILNRVLGVKLPYKRLPENHNRGRAVTAEELGRLATALSKPRRRYAWIATMIALNTGLRRGEVSRLTWDDIYLDRRLILVRGTKTPAARRVIPINDGLNGVLVNWKQNSPHSRLNVIPVKSWRTAWRDACREAGLPGLRFHDLRHTVTTALLEDPTISEETVRALMGWVSPEMFRIYGHIRQEKLAKAVTILSHTAHLLPEGETSRSSHGAANSGDMVGTARFELATPCTPSNDSHETH